MNLLVNSLEALPCEGGTVGLELREGAPFPVRLVRSGRREKPRPLYD